MQLIENFSAIINYPLGRQTLVHFADGRLSIGGLGIDDAMTVIKVLESSARPQVAKPSPEQPALDVKPKDVLKARAEPQVESPKPDVEIVLPQTQVVPVPAPKPTPPQAQAVPMPAPKPTPPAIVVEPEPEPEKSPMDLDHELEALGIAMPGKSAVAATPEPKKRGRPPGSTNKPKVPAADQAPPPVDPRQRDWTDEIEQAAPAPAPKSKPKKSGAMSIPTDNPPEALCAPRLQLPEVYQYLTASGKFEGTGLSSIELEPQLQMQPLSCGAQPMSADEVLTKAVALIREDTDATAEQARRIVESNAFRWMLLHAIEVVEERARGQVKPVANALRGSTEFPLLRVITRAAAVIIGQPYYSDYYNLTSDVGPRG